MENIQIKTVVISLPSRQDRREKIAQVLSNNKSIDWSFFDACSGDSPSSLDISVSDQKKYYGRALTSSEIGCFKSHHAVISQFSESNSNDTLLVLEDDVWLDPDFDVRNLVDFCSARKIHYIRLFSKTFPRNRFVEKFGDERYVVRFLTDPYGAQAYLITKSGAQRFLNGVNNIVRPVDDELGRFWINGLIPYCIFPFPIIERSFYSSIRSARDLANSQERKSTIKGLLYRLLEKFRKEYFNIKLL